MFVFVCQCFVVRVPICVVAGTYPMGPSGRPLQGSMSRPKAKTNTNTNTNAYEAETPQTPDTMSDFRKKMDAFNRGSRAHPP
jgi:hypothetical protein